MSHQILHFVSDAGDDEYIVIFDRTPSLKEQQEHCASGFTLYAARQCPIEGCHLLPTERPLSAR